MHNKLSLDKMTLYEEKTLPLVVAQCFIRIYPISNWLIVLAVFNMPSGFYLKE